MANLTEFRQDFLSRGTVRFIELTSSLAKDGLGDGRQLDLAELLLDAMQTMDTPATALSEPRQRRLMERVWALAELDRVAADNAEVGSGPLPYPDAPGVGGRPGMGSYKGVVDIAEDGTFTPNIKHDALRALLIPGDYYRVGQVEGTAYTLDGYYFGYGLPSRQLRPNNALVWDGAHFTRFETASTLEPLYAVGDGDRFVRDVATVLRSLNAVAFVPNAPALKGTIVYNTTPDGTTTWLALRDLEGYESSLDPNNPNGESGRWLLLSSTDTQGSDAFINNDTVGIPATGEYATGFVTAGIVLSPQQIDARIRQYGGGGVSVVNKLRGGHHLLLGTSQAYAEDTENPLFVLNMLATFADEFGPAKPGTFRLTPDPAGHSAGWSSGGEDETDRAPGEWKLVPDENSRNALLNRLDEAPNVVAGNVYAATVGGQELLFRALQAQAGPYGSFVLPVAAGNAYWKRISPGGTAPSPVVLYGDTGQNTDGAMTQKAVSDAIALVEDAVGELAVTKQNALGYTPADLAGATFVGAVYYTGARTENDARLATYGEMRDAVNGLSFKDEARVLLTAIPGGGTLATAGLPLVQSVQLVEGDRVILNLGSALSGIYVAKAATWTRATDADTRTKILRATIFVLEGTYALDGNGNPRRWTATLSPSGVLGTTAFGFVESTGASSYSNGVGISLIGTTFSLDATTDLVPEGTNVLRRYFTEARALATVLAGYAKAGTNRALAVGDSVLTALGVLEKKIDDNTSSIGTLASLPTTAKSSLVAAITEVNTKAGAPVVYGETALAAPIADFAATNAFPPQVTLTSTFNLNDLRNMKPGTTLTIRYVSTAATDKLQVGGIDVGTGAGQGTRNILTSTNSAQGSSTALTVIEEGYTLFSGTSGTPQYGILRLRWLGANCLSIANRPL